MPAEALTPEIPRGREVAERRFDPRSAAPFVYKSTSEGLPPHDLRRTATTRALDSGLSHRQARMMPKRRGPKAAMRDGQGKENMEMNAVNSLGYDDEA